MFTIEEGLPSADVNAIGIDARGRVHAGTAGGLARLDGDRWKAVDGLTGVPIEGLLPSGSGLYVSSRNTLYFLDPDGPPAPVTSSLPPLHGAKRRALALEGPRGSKIYIGSGEGLFTWDGSEIRPVAGLNESLGAGRSVTDVTVGDGGQVLAATHAGLFLSTDRGESWRRLFPSDASRSWAPIDVRAAAFDPEGRLWFASPQGTGYRQASGGAWTLFTGAEGLPYDDFTSMATGPAGDVWFGTHVGAIRYDHGTWEYRQGRRWLPDDDVRDVAIGQDGRVWFATSSGVGLIESRFVTLAEKARFFEDEIDKYHRRTPYQYVLSVTLANPDDKSRSTQHDSDNDGLWTGMYGAGECFAYAATGDPKAKERATKAFEALRFLSQVTQGGSNPAPPGFIARTILPTSGHNPNVGRLERDRRERDEGDALWKVIDPRWPVNADGKWYWKTDASSDELDGHYFFYSLYYDLVAETDAEKERVRLVVQAITDHLIEHDFSLVDHDGKPTRWANFGPSDINHNKSWWEERGLNSLSILSYLRVAKHMSGDEKYDRVAEGLIKDHSYAMNVLVPKMRQGVGVGNQSDDEMAFMSLYDLVRYEEDPDLKQIWTFAFFRYWQWEAPELNPLFNFMYAAVGSDGVYTDAFGDMNLTPHGPWLEESIDTLKRYPLDRVQWAMRNSHRKDIAPRESYGGGNGGRRRGARRNARALPIDERWLEHWNHDPWTLDYGGDGRNLADGASFLLPYYMGLYHGFIIEDGSGRD